MKDATTKKDERIPRERIAESRDYLDKHLQSVSTSIETGVRLTDDQMSALGNSMMKHLLTLGEVASW